MNKNIIIITHTIRICCTRHATRYWCSVSFIVNSTISIGNYFNRHFVQSGGRLAKKNCTETYQQFWTEGIARSSLSSSRYTFSLLRVLKIRLKGEKKFLPEIYWFINWKRNDDITRLHSNLRSRFTAFYFDESDGGEVS